MIQLNQKFSRNNFTLNNLKIQHNIAYIVPTPRNTIFCLVTPTLTTAQPLSKLIHTNAVLYSDRNRVNLEHTINESLNSRVNNLQLVKYNDKLDKNESVDAAESSFSESFPWLTDADGKPIEFNETISMFEGVKLVSDYLVKNLKIDSNLISDGKLTEILELFKDKDSNKEITILELFKGLNKIYSRTQGADMDGISYLDKEKVLEKLTDNIRNDLDGSASGEKLNSDSNGPVPNIFNYSRGSDTPQNTNTHTSQMSNMEPLGSLGNTTLTQIGVAIRDSQLNYNIFSNSTKLAVHVAPLVTNLVSFGFIIKGYINHVHNRPLRPHLNAAQIQQELKLRRSQLGAFLLVGAPLTYFLVKSVGLSFKDVLKVEFNVGENVGSDGTPNSHLKDQTEATASPSSTRIDNNSPNIINTNNANSESWLFLLLSKINKKIPSWIKLFFKLLFGGIVVLKLLGISVISVMTGVNSTFYLRLIVYTISILSITFQLLNLYFLHKFNNCNGQSKISEVLPNFIIKWLKGIEIMSTTKEGIQSLKENCYIEISLYIVIIILVTLIS
jgi:hypothetical protein